MGVGTPERDGRDHPPGRRDLTVIANDTAKPGVVSCKYWAQLLRQAFASCRPTRTLKRMFSFAGGRARTAGRILNAFRRRIWAEVFSRQWACDTRGRGGQAQDRCGKILKLVRANLHWCAFLADYWASVLRADCAQLQSRDCDGGRHGHSDGGTHCARGRDRP